MGDIFVTATGDINVIDQHHFEVMKDGRHRRQLRATSTSRSTSRRWRRWRAEIRRVREFVDEYILADGRRIYLAGEGRLVNLAAAEGHPSAVMDMSFANQALAAEYMVKNHGSLERTGLQRAGGDRQEIARLKLAAMGVNDRRRSPPEQEAYLNEWRMGT